MGYQAGLVLLESVILISGELELGCGLFSRII